MKSRFVALTFFVSIPLVGIGDVSVPRNLDAVGANYYVLARAVPVASAGLSGIGT